MKTFGGVIVGEDRVVVVGGGGGVHRVGEDILGDVTQMRIVKHA